MPPNTAVEADKEEKEMNGVTKAAILLMSLKPDTSARILKILDDNLVEEITREIAQLDLIDENTRSRVIEDFYNLAMARRYVEVGGIAYARTLLNKALSPNEARRILKIIENQVFQQPFAFLQKTESENLLMFIQDEHPQTIALVLAHVEIGRASCRERV